jgi:3-hydroxybutyryl-CoA dehydrogenase
VHNLGVIGTGLMGTGIAPVAAQAGLQVCLSDIGEEALQRAVATIRRGLERLQERGRLEGDVETILTRIRTTTVLQDYAASDFDTVV